MEDLLEKIFDSPVRARLFRLFLRNPEKWFKVGEISDRVQFHPRPVKAQINRLHTCGFLKRKRVLRREKKGRPKITTKIITGPKLSPGVYYATNLEFDLIKELQQLIYKAAPRSEEQLTDRFKKIGGVKLALVSGIFMGLEHIRADLLLVGDNMNQQRLKKMLVTLEAEFGTEVNYTTMTSQDFAYRFDMFDRFIRDILEGPHKKLINKFKI